MRHCHRRSSCSSSSRLSCVTAIGGHRVHRHRGHRCHCYRRSSCINASEVIIRHCNLRSSCSSSSQCVSLSSEVIVRQCYQRSSCLSSSRSSLSLQSEVIVCIHGIVIIAIGVKIYRRYGRELRSYIDVVIAKIGSKK